MLIGHVQFVYIISHWNAVTTFVHNYTSSFLANHIIINYIITASCLWLTAVSDCYYVSNMPRVYQKSLYKNWSIYSTCKCIECTNFVGRGGGEEY